MQIDYAKKLIANIEIIRKIKGNTKNGEDVTSSNFAIHTQKCSGNLYFSGFTLYCVSDNLYSNNIGLNDRFRDIVRDFLIDNKLELLERLEKSLVDEVLKEKERIVNELVDDLSLINKF